MLIIFYLDTGNRINVVDHRVLSVSHFLLPVRRDSQMICNRIEGFFKEGNKER